MAGLRDELRALRRDREQDRRKLEALEAQLAAMSRRERSAADGAAPPSRRFAPPDGLAVVRLAPTPAPELPPEPEDDDSFVFIVDRGGGETAPAPRPGVGGPLGVDAAPPLPVEVELRDPVDPGAYEEGLRALGQGDAVAASASLERFLADHPEDGRADNAHLALGDAYRAQQLPGRALDAYEQVVTRYPAGDAVPEALLRYGETCLALGRKAAARAAFVRLVEDHPHTEAASRAGRHLDAR